MREMKSTVINGRIYLFPVPVIKGRKYLISCSTELEAEKISLAIKTKKIVHPDLVSENFLFLTHHTDNETKIYVLNPKIEY